MPITTLKPGRILLEEACLNISRTRSEALDEAVAAAAS